MSVEDKTPTTDAQELPSLSTVDDSSLRQHSDQKDVSSFDRAKEGVLGSKRVHKITNKTRNVAKEAKKLKSNLNGPHKEKLRAFLNYWVTPSVRVNIFEEKKTESSTLDIDLLPDTLIGDTDSFSIPRRMFDVDEKNMVDTFSLSPEDEYCMLSHSWKGMEVDLKFFSKAQKTVRGKTNDVNGVLKYCHINLVEKQKALMESCNMSDPAAIRNILSMYIEANDAEWRYTSAKIKRREANSEQAHWAQEEKQYKSLLKSFGKDWQLDSLENRNKKNQSNQDDEISRLRGQVEKHRANLERDVFYAIKDMLEALQRHRSARKLQNSIDRARKIFDEKPFLNLGKRYIWLDTCCIDKSNNSELTESLARMGEWYANADFCLVHLDTTNDEKDWLDEWDLWNGRGLTPRSGPLEHFGGIKEWKPRWSTRGWTLQELVLSKMTYFVNPEWKLLERGVDNLGRYYSLCPFVELYTRGSCHAYTDQLDFGQLAADIKSWNKDYHSSGESKPNGNTNTQELQNQGTVIPLLTYFLNVLVSFIPEQLKAARSPGVEPNIGDKWDKRALITYILETFNFAIPRQLTEDNARIRIGQSVRHTIENLKDQMPSSDDQFQGPTTTPVYLLQCLQRYLNIPMGSKAGEHIKPVIDLLLYELAMSSIDEIVRDRDDISSFSKVGLLKSWSKGIRRDNFSAHSVMNLASERSVSVPADTAYSLMGILRVQFPAFHAEGLPKALSRLMDEVVITSNDVSVFNWSGKHNISPLKGRSLYPCNIDAFQIVDSEEANNVDRELVRRFRKERIKYLGLARQVNLLLAHAINYATFVENDDETIECLRKMVDFINGKDLHDHSGLLQSLLSSRDPSKDLEDRDLFKDLEEASRLVNDIREPNSRKKAQKNENPEAGKPNGQSEDVTPETRENENEGNDMKKQEGTTQHAPDESKELPKAQGNDEAENPKKAGKPEKPKKDKNDDRIKLQGLGLHIRERINQMLERQSDGVKIKHERKGEDDKKDDKEDDKKVDDKKEESQAKRKKSNKSYSSQFEGLDEPIVCPNPIAVNSSGITGVFDIQRVVMTMLDPQTLRSKIENAAGAYEMIDGWCTISTGLGLTMVAFSCERYMLKHQMDVADVMEENVLKDPHKKHPKPEAPSGPDQDKSPRVERNQNELQSEEQVLEKTYGNSSEQRKVTRMVDFVTESDLHLVAGEWVLARFSGSPGAKWFLCRLELGNGNTFYARRIATDDFDFHDALPEKGLVQYWHEYLRAKKGIMGDVLSSLLSAKKPNLINWLSNPIQDPAGEASDQKPENGDGKNGGKPDENMEPEIQHQNPNPLSKLDNLFHRGMLAMAPITRAKRLESQSREKAMANVPARLQAAIEALDKNKGLLPIMFHSARDVHFF